MNGVIAFLAGLTIAICAGGMYWCVVFLLQLKKELLNAVEHAADIRVERQIRYIDSPVARGYDTPYSVVDEYRAEMEANGLEVSKDELKDQRRMWAQNEDLL